MSARRIPIPAAVREALPDVCERLLRAREQLLYAVAAECEPGTLEARDAADDMASTTALILNFLKAESENTMRRTVALEDEARAAAVPSGCVRIFRQSYRAGDMEYFRGCFVPDHLAPPPSYVDVKPAGFVAQMQPRRRAVAPKDWTSSPLPKVEIGNTGDAVRDIRAAIATLTSQGIPRVIASDAVFRADPHRFMAAKGRLSERDPRPFRRADGQL
jgi:hypothetical protein